LQQRHVGRVVTVPPLAPGFVGPGHLAAPVLSPEDSAANDPFILLMDDHLDIGDRRIDGPHTRMLGSRPSPSFSTAKFTIATKMEFLKQGEVQWMTAGRGIIHGEDMYTNGRVRVLQLFPSRSPK